MHPFHFTTDKSFTCADPDSCFAFEPTGNNKFHWYGKELDKLGHYLLLVQGENLFMELEWNYGRERTYTVVSTEGVDDDMTGFILKDHKTGKTYAFRR